MAFPDLQSFIQALDEKGYLRRIQAQVDPILEISAIADRVSKQPAADRQPPPATDPTHGKQGGHALLFENVTGADWPVAINLYGSYERMNMALGCDSLEELANRVRMLLKTGSTHDLSGQNQKAASTRQAGRIRAQNRQNRNLPGSRTNRQHRPDSLANDPVLAPRRPGWIRGQAG